MTPRDLADLLCADLSRRGAAVPPLDSLVNLLEVAFFASMRTEEARALSATLAWVDPAAPDPARPERVRPHRWTITPLADPMPLTVNSLAKLGQAAPRRAASIAVCADEVGRPYAWGLIDQARHEASAVDHEDKRRFARAGAFQIEVGGAAELSLYDDARLIATLRKNELLGEPVNVFAAGPVRARLDALLAPRAEALRQAGVGDYASGRLLTANFIAVLCRLLDEMSRLRQGGALVLLPSPAPAAALSDLRCKHRLHYARLEDAVIGSVAAQARHYEADQDIEDLFQAHAGESRSLSIPYFAWCAESVAAAERDDWFLALDGAVAFVTALSRVDGVVLFEGGLTVGGFGGELLARRDPEVLFLARDAQGIEGTIERGSFDHFGTRHRSMMRYCNSHPAALGLVVSHDGDVRALARVDDRLALWENVQLHDRALSTRLSVGGYADE